MRKEGLTPKPQLFSFASYHNDPLAEGYSGHGFGLFFNTWLSHRHLWEIVGYYERLNRPKWKKTTVESYRILHVSVTIWSRNFYGYFRLWRVRVSAAN